jgi:hypothetical protein
MKFDDAFYRGFHDELNGFQKEAWIPQALMLGGRLLAGARALGTAAKATRAGTALARAGGAAARVARPATTAVKNVASKARGGAGGLWKSMKQTAGRAMDYVPFMGGGGGQQRTPSHQKKYV